MADLGVDTSKMDPAFVEALVRMFAAAPPEIAGKLRIGSGYRDEQTQAKLYADAVAKYGSEDAARKWVAPPGKSRHNHGAAADLSFGDDAVKKWVHDNAAAYGLHFPMAWEPWHVEPAGARGAPPPTVAGQPAPQQPPAAPAVPAGVDIKALLAAFTPTQQPAPQTAQGGLVDPQALMSFGSDWNARKAKEEADRKARLRALLT